MRPAPQLAPGWNRMKRSERRQLRPNLATEPRQLPRIVTHNRTEADDVARNRIRPCYAPAQ